MTLKTGNQMNEERECSHEFYSRRKSEAKKKQ